MRITIAIATLATTLSIAAIAHTEQRASARQSYSLAIDTADGNEWIADKALSLDDCRLGALSARTHRPSHTGAPSRMVDIVCVPERNR